MRTRRWGRLVALLAALAATVPTTAEPAAGGTGGTGGIDRAAQPAPTLTVAPPSGLHDGDEAVVTITGWGGAGLLALYQCDAAVLDHLEDRSRCVPLWFEFSGVGDPYVKTVQVSELLTVGEADDGSDDVLCSHDPGACAIVAWTPVTNRTLGAAFDMDPDPLALTPRSHETGFAVRTVVTLPPGTASAQLAECALPVAATLAGSRCTAPQPVALAADGTARPTFGLVDEFTAAGTGEPVACADGGCAVALFDAGGATVHWLPVSVFASDGPPRISGTFTTGLNDGVVTRVDITGIRNEGVTLAQCDASVTTAAEVTSGPCGPPLHTLAPSQSTIGTSPDVTVRSTIAAVDGSTVDCRRHAGACVLAVASNLGNFTKLPISFRVPDVITLTPAAGLLDGQAVTVDAANLEPEATYHVLVCDGLSELEGARFDDRKCDRPMVESPTVVSSPQGTLTTTVAVHQRFTTREDSPRRVVCRAQCQVALVLDDRLSPYGVTRYAMADGEITASPSTGLADGQTVTVTGSDLMASYDGPMFLFLTSGVWALAECGPGVLDDPTVGGVLVNCGFPPGSGVVDVPGSTFGRDVRVAATVRPTLGDPVDCRAGSRSCVLLLGRIEQDGTTSLHTTPISFAP